MEAQAKGRVAGTEHTRETGSEKDNGRRRVLLPAPVRLLDQSGDEPAPEARPGFNWRGFAFRVVGAFATVSLIVLAWWAVAVVGNYPGYLLPTPLAVAERIWAMLLDGSLIRHFWTTILEAGLGFLVALLLGTSLGYLIAHSHILERLASPYIALSQGLPVVAIAPLLVLWVRDDLSRKVIIVALIVFFPILVSTIVGLRSIDRSMLEVARISGANHLQTIRYVELPLSLRALLGGIKLGLTLSITGAVVGEFVSSGAGLGFLLMLGRGLFDTTLIFVGLVSLALLTMLAYLGITLLEKTLITWE
jgi:NitT/TauT family transport system permease protein